MGKSRYDVQFTADQRSCLKSPVRHRKSNVPTIRHGTDSTAQPGKLEKYDYNYRRNGVVCGSE